MRQKSNVPLSFPRAGECKAFGFVGKMIDFTVQKQYLDRETWRVLVDQFRLHSDVDNDWRGEFWGKLMRGASLTYRATKNEKLYAVLTETVLDLLSTQEKNGRISSYPQEKEFLGWDMWSRKYVMLGLEYFLEICKSKVLKEKVMKALIRHADYIINRVGEGKERSIFDTSQVYGGLNSCSILEPFVKLYVLTEKREYLDFSAYLVNSGFCRDCNIIELCLSKKSYPYQFKYTKAYEMASCFEGLLEYYKTVGGERYLQAVENFIAMVAETDYTLIGGSGCTHELFDHSTKMQTEKTQQVMQETCVAVTFMKLCAKLLAVTGNAKYAEYIERSGMNALLGAVNNENQLMYRAEARKWVGDKMFLLEHEAYPFDSYSPLFQDRRGRRVAGFKELQNGRSYGCCACISGAGTAILGLFAVMKGKDGIYVNFYNNSRFKTEADGERVDVCIYANPYGRAGAKLRIKGGTKPFALALRIPVWAEGFTVFVNGEKTEISRENGYGKISRIWRDALVEIRYSTPVKAVLRNGKVAFTRGPIVLARDERFEEITPPVEKRVKNGGAVRARLVKNPLFYSNLTVKIPTKNGEITLCDYSQAGKNYDEERCNITVWQERKR